MSVPSNVAWKTACTGLPRSGTAKLQTPSSFTSPGAASNGVRTPAARVSAAVLQRPGKPPLTQRFGIEVRDPQRDFAGLAGNGDRAGRLDLRQNRRGPVEPAELIERKSARLLLPKDVQETLARVRACLGHHDVHDRPVRIAVARRIQPRLLKSLFLVMALQRVGGVETGVAPGPVKSRRLQGRLVILETSRRRNRPGELRRQTRIQLDAEVQVLVGDKGDLQRVKRARPQGVTEDASP